MPAALLLNAVTATGAGPSIEAGSAQGRTFQGVVAGTGAVGATIDIQGSADGTTWETLATLTLSGTTTAHDGVALLAPWTFVRGNVSAISGTGAAATLKMGV